MASCSSSVSHPASAIQLPDLIQDVLILIFRDYVPLQDKLHTLSKMKEFQHLFQNRACYLNAPLPFSLDYIQLLRSIRPGWYIRRSNWSHRFCLRIDERTLHFSIHHYLLEGYLDVYAPNYENKRGRFRGTIAHMRRNLSHFLIDYQCMQDAEILNFNLKGYGLIIVDHSYSSNVQTLRFYDHTRCAIRIGKPKQMIDRFGHRVHFIVLLTREKKLIVTCIRRQGTCLCQQRVQHLSPFTFEVSEDYKRLTWDGGPPIPLAICHDFGLGRRNDILIKMTHHIKSYRIDMLADTRRRLHEQLRRVVADRGRARQQAPPKKRRNKKTAEASSSKKKKH